MLSVLPWNRLEFFERVYDVLRRLNNATNHARSFFFNWFCPRTHINHNYYK